MSQSRCRFASIFIGIFLFFYSSIFAQEGQILCGVMETQAVTQQTNQCVNNIEFVVYEILNKVCGLTSIDGIILSAIDQLSISATCNLDPVIDAISESDALLCSKLEIIESKLDNLSVSACDVNFDPVITAIDQSEQVLCSKLEIIDSKIDVLNLSRIEVIVGPITFTIGDLNVTAICDLDPVLIAISESEALLCSKIDSLGGVPCAPTPIFVSTTITAEGVYCLANMITGPIRISHSDVVLDMSERRVDGGILLDGGIERITIMNGVVQNSGGAAIAAGPTVTNVTIENVLACDSDTGIFLDGTSGGAIINSKMEHNSTGLLLNNSYKIEVLNSIASGNEFIGFSLMSSSSNSFKDCSAINTGIANTQTADNEVFGFVSQDGHSNIFERCIANATQALSTTDSNSVIAGFALRGDEKCTKIIDSEAANSTASANGVTIPYGILLEAQFDGLVTVTNQPDTVSFVRGVSWTPDGKYLVAASANTDQLLVYEFDRVVGSLTKIIDQSASDFSQSVTVTCSPDGNYIAVILTGSNKVAIYEFNRSTSSLTLVANEDAPSAPQSVSWSPDGTYLAVASFSATELTVYEFNKVSGSLTSAANSNIAGGGARDVAWSPDGKYLALALDSSNTVRIYQFDRVPASLTPLTTQSGTSPQAVTWSPNGKYLAISFGSNIISIYEFDRESVTLNFVTNQSNSITGPIGIAWSPDGQYLASALISLSKIYIYKFDASSNALDFMGSSGGTLGGARDVAWSPDGRFVAVSGTITINIYDALTFPSKNVIKGNTVYCNSGGNCPSGVGISGSSIQNLIIGNTAYSNPVPQGANHPIVGSNYYFVTNVFNQMFGQAPSDLQNISVDGCAPICTPTDLALLAEQIKYKVCVPIPSQLDVIESKIDTIPFGVTAIDVNLNTQIDINVNLATQIDVQVSGIDSILVAISESEAALCSKIDNLPFGATHVDVNLNITTQIDVNLTTQIDVQISGLDNILVAISESEAVLCSKIDNLPFGATAVDVNLTTQIDINASLQDVIDVIQSGDDILCSKLNIIESQLDTMSSAMTSPCAPIAITAPTTITAEGIYCVATTIMGAIEIAADNVDLDLNNYRIADGVAVTGARNCITIHNGTVEKIGSGSAISVYPGSGSINIDDVLAKNADIGIQFMGVTGGRISNVEMTQNTTGLELINSQKITVDNSVASCNTQAGFDLIDSFDNCIRESKAISTGDGNSATTGNIFGFVSSGGHNNIFENTVSNHTQGLQTDCDSVVAAYALRDEERCTKIINSEAANTTTNPSSLVIPYGIWLESTLNSPITLTATPVIPTPSADVNAVQWRQDQKYFAAGYNSAVSVYSFNNVTKVASKVADGVTAPTGTVNDLDWSPDGTLLAVATTTGIFVYEFCPINCTLKLVAMPSTQPSATVTSLDWHPSGKYLAAGTAEPSIYVYTFDRVAQTLTQLFTPVLSNTDQINDVQWSPDGNYLAAVDSDAPANRDLFIYRFNKNSSQLSLVSSVGIGNITAYAVAWRFDGKYVAVGGDQTLHVYEINNGVIDPNSWGYIQGDTIFALDWSDDGKYIVIGTDNSATALPDYIQIIKFDPCASRGTPCDGLMLVSVPDVPPTDTVNGIDWSPDGQFILAGTDDDNLRIAVYEALEFPSKNVITNNVVYCNSGNECPGGIGIYGSSIKNLIIENTAYANPINPPVIGSNYVFVTNVFNQLFGQAPSDLQNISVDGCHAICVPEDPILLLKQIKMIVTNLSLGDVSVSSMCDLDPVLEAISASDVLLCSKIDNIPFGFTSIDINLNTMFEAQVSGLDGIYSAIDNSTQVLCSKLEIIESQLDALTVSTSCDLEPVLEAISASDVLLCSKIENIPFGFTAIDINLNTMFEAQVSGLDGIYSAIDNSTQVLCSKLEIIESQLDGLSISATCDLEPVLEAISASDVLLCSKIDNIPFGVTAIDVNVDVSTQIDINVTTQIDVATSGLDEILEAISESESTLCSKLEIIDSKIDLLNSSFACDLDPVLSAIDDAEQVLCSKLEIIESLLELPSCEPTPITAPTTITAEGVYCVANTIPGEIEINGSDIVVLLNSYDIEGGIDILPGSDNVSIFNGTVTGASDAIHVEGATNITLENVKARRATISGGEHGVGIHFVNVIGGLIKNCEMTQNVTGLELVNSYNVTIKDSIATSNRNAGFSLISSFTNCIINSKAIGTGDGNNNTNDNIFGFVAENGGCNIFENSIADGTQGKNVTNFNSLVAGFALRGSEGCSKIINSEAANATVAPTGVTIPYGILIEGSISNPLTLTGVPSIPMPGDGVNAIEWSPDQKLLAVGTDSASDAVRLRVYAVDNTDKTISQVATPDIVPEDTVLALSWHPSGQFIAVGMLSGDAFRVRVYEYCSANNSLKQVATPNIIPGGNITSVDWSPNGKYLAVGGADDVVRIYAFDAVAYTLTQIITQSVTSFQALEWHPSGRFLGVVTSSDFYVYGFNSGSSSLTVAATQPAPNAFLSMLSWTADGKFVALVNFADSGEDQTYTIETFLFDGQSLISGATIVLTNQSVVDLDWSSDGRYLAAIVSNSATVYPFDRTGSTSFGSAINVDINPGGLINGINWSPDGEYIAVGTSSGVIALYEALSFPHKNVITNNTVYCNSGNMCPGGVGISGSSIANMITRNTAYANPIPQSINHPFVQTNYVFVQNVFNQLFGQAPSDVQNISIDACEPICTPADLALIAKQIKYKVCNIDSQLDVIESKIDNLPFGVTAIDINLSTQIDVNATVIFELITQLDVMIALSGLDDILMSISESDALLCSKFEVLESKVDVVGDVVVDIDSQLDVVESKIDNLPFGATAIDINLSTQIDVTTSGLDEILNAISESESTLCSKLEIIESILELPTCAPTVITAPTTITAEGAYCVANTIMGAIQIDASNVDLDLSGNRISDGILVSSGQDSVTIHNGIVEKEGAGSAIAVEPGASNITIDDVIARSADIGIEFNGVIGGHISNVEMTQNGTGLELDNSYKVTVDHAIASCNRNAGFSLVSSFTNCIINSKAVGTGDGNNNTNDNIFGFVAENGGCNIFENSVANGTQGANITDFNALVAGFALRGSEGCSKIINSEAANATVDPTGVTIPYGILIEGSISNPLTLTGVPAIPMPGDGVNAIEWSPDQKLLAVGTDSASDAVRLRVYAVDNTDKTISQVATPDIVPEDTVLALSWHPSGQFIAVGMLSGDAFRVRVYEYCSANNSLKQVATPNIIPGGNITSVDWSPNGKYLAVGGADDVVRIYAFDAVAYTLTQIITQSVTSFQALEWHPSGRFLGVVTSLDFYVYGFNPGSSSLNVITTQAPNNNSFDSYLSWSLDGKFVALVDVTTGGEGDERTIETFFFDGQSLAAGATINVFTNSVKALDWSSDGRYLAAIVGNLLQVYPFDRTGSTSFGSAINVDSNPGGLINGINWSPDGEYIAVGTSSGVIALYEALSFPHKNVITNNTVYCNSGNMCPGGVGISGSSIANMITRNTAYANPIPQSINHPFVQTNYVFVQNVFNQLFGQAPSDVQNISIDACEPICTPADLALIAKQIKYKVCNIDSQLDVIESKIDNISVNLSTVDVNLDPILSAIDVTEQVLCSKLEIIESILEVPTCAPTPITQSTTITAEGVYCLANEIISGGIEIAASDVVLDLSGRRVTGGIAVTGGQDHVTVMNGVVENVGGIAISADTGSTNIAVDSVLARNSEIGIKFDGVVGGAVSNSEMTLNSTGLEFETSFKIEVSNSVASCNTHVGFSLISSSTNIFTDVKALGTGQGNTQTVNNEVFGFVSIDGHSNIFERAIANATQALSTTDSNSVVAGFALRGDEKCTKIIDSEAANSTTSPDGVTVPYGILIEGTLDSLIQFTNQSGPTVLTNPQSSQWSPDGKYVAVADDGINEVLIYEFDRVFGSLSEVTRQSGTTVLINPQSSQWSPDGNYVAVADQGSNVIVVYEFDRGAGTLTEITTQSGSIILDSVLTPNWSPDGNYIAAITSAPVAAVVIYEFDRVAGTLIQIATQSGSTTLSALRDVSWSPDGKYVAVSDQSNAVLIYAFDAAAPSLTEIPTATTAFTNVLTLGWSPDGKYLAIGDTANSMVLIYEFDRASGILNAITSQSGSTTLLFIRDLSWSPDGKYIAVADVNADVVVIYEFDRGVPSLNEVTTQSGSAVDFPRDVSWSPDGAYLAVADLNLNQVIIYSAINFPSKNVIKGNTVYCNSGGNCPSGVGISGSSIQNLIIGNTAYSNPVPQGANHPIVGSNYQFVTNVFNQMFGQAPSDLQNISVDGCAPICTPTDLALLAKQILYKVCVPIPSQLDVIESKIDAISFSAADVNLNPVLSAIDVTEQVLCSKLEIIESVLEVPTCAPTVITAPTTITAEGAYCVADPIMGAIQIDASNVDLDLSGNRISDGILVTSGQDSVTIHNGIVEKEGAGSAIAVEPGASNINIDGIIARSADIGIEFNGVIGGHITNVEMTQNGTGLELDNSYKVTVDHAIASCNRNAGFSLVSSFTNCIINSKAVATGDGNNNTNDNIFGFVAENGGCNIFENSVANGTQGANVTDFNALVAGFALRGSEGCSKIINSEAANATVDPTGVAIPYGILLEHTLDSTLTQTATPVVGESTYSLDWSPDGKFLAAVSNTLGSNSTLVIYAFDTVRYVFTNVAQDQLSNSGLGNIFESVRWSPSGQFVAYGTADGIIRIFNFDRATYGLTLFVTNTDLLFINSIDWSPDGRYLVAGNDGPNRMATFKFDPIASTLVQIDTTTGADYVDWSPDGNFIAGVSGGGDLYVYNVVNGEFGASATVNLGGDNGRAVAWSPNGKYIATVDNGTLIRVFSLDRTTITLTQEQTSAVLSSADMASIDWSADSRYIAYTEDGSTLAIYEADLSATLMQVATASLSSVSPFEVRWSPDGSLLSVGLPLSSAPIETFQAFNFPSKNVVINNTVYCNSGGMCPQGVGISGSSIKNLIIGNTAYSNPVPQGANHPIVGSNYQFVTNVFNQMFGQAPSDLQNISVDGCAPICTPTDLALLAKQILYKVCVPIPSQLDVIESKIDAISFSAADVNLTPVLSAIDVTEQVLCSKLEIIESVLEVPTCAPTPITQSTTITAEGVYCLANEITSGGIEIAASDVVLDLSDRRVTGGIAVTGGQDHVTVMNGVVENVGGIALSADTGSTNITVDSVLARNSSQGIRFGGVVGGIISNCELANNVIGLRLTESFKINIDNTIASCNKISGFSLLRSSTNVLTDCKALGTGDGNTLTANNAVVGFSSEDGHSNIFERCIANATQALSTTDSNSVVAGFALIGDEKCTKIIDSEAANSTTSPDGVTVPFGILLNATVNNPITLTTSVDTLATDVSWSSDGKYLAAVTTTNVIVYQYDYQDNNLEQITSTEFSGSIFSPIEWHPSNRYLAVGGADAINLYEFCAINNSLTLKDQKAMTQSRGASSVSWSSDGKFLAVADLGNCALPPNDDSIIRFYSFDEIVVSLVPSGETNSVFGNCASIDWRADNEFIAAEFGDCALLVQIYRYDRVNKVVTETGSITGFEPTFVQWSPDGKLLAVIGGGFLHIYQYNEANQQLLLLNSLSIPAITSASEWSPDSKYIAVNDDVISIYEFDRGSNQLILVSQGEVAVDLYIKWSPDGRYISANLNTEISIFEALTFPSKNLIKGNTVYCNSGGNCPSGVGISGSSIQNLIIGNTAYSNPVPQGPNHPIVGSNYQFVTNVFNQMFGQAPSDLQNISVDGCAPICTPTDLGLLAKQILYKVCVPIPSQLDVIESKIDAISFSAADVNLNPVLSAIDVTEQVLCSKLEIIESILEVPTCAAIPIFEADLPTTISVSGVYCLAEDVTISPADHAITIATDDVTIDLNDHVANITNRNLLFSNGYNNITVQNGSINISGTAYGFDIQNGKIITLSDINITVDQVGIYLSQVSNSVIENCRIAGTGVEDSISVGIYLQDSHSLEILDTICIGKKYGFYLIQTSTCCVKDCKAIDSGKDVTQKIDTEVFGFVSTNGHSNIFERCIANATQALSTTDYNSVVAGFALRGDEKCTKIIDSEAANSTTSPDGVTVPFGILLEAQFDGIVSITNVLDSDFREVSWSPDGKYVAAAIFVGNSVSVYAFDRVTESLTFVDGASGVNPISVSWSPDGNYLAAAFLADGFLNIYSFDRNAGTLTLKNSISTSGNTRSVSWSPDGNYLAVGLLTGIDSIRVYSFDRNAEILTLQDSLSASDPTSVSWSPDGKYIAAAISTGNVVNIYAFDEGVGSLTFINGISGTNPLSVSWSPDGKYIAAALLAGNSVNVYEFNRDTISLTLVDGVSGTNPLSVSWSPDGKYIAAALLAGNSVNVYEFDSGAGSLTLKDSESAMAAISVSWSPDGSYLAAGLFAGGDSLEIYQVLTFPSKNVIKGNTVYCNSGGNCPSGVGISGSSIQNLIIGNTAYSNPVPQGANHPIVGSNYQFVTNVFNQMFGQAPSDLQNISVDGCAPICTPTDLALLAQQIKYKVCVPIPSQLDVIESKIDAISFSAADVNLEPVLIAISESDELLCSKLEVIESKIDQLSNVDVNLEPVLIAISESDEMLCSKLEIIESDIEVVGDLVINVDTDLSIHDVTICSKLEVIESKIDAIDFSNTDVNLEPVLVAISDLEELLCSKLEIIQSKEDIINDNVINVDTDLSIHDERICSKLEVIESKIDDIGSVTDRIDNNIGSLTDAGSCLEGIIANMPDDINNFQLNVIQLLKTILLELRGCCDVGN